MENKVPGYFKDAFEKRLKDRKEEVERKPIIKGLTDKIEPNRPINGL